MRSVVLTLAVMCAAPFVQAQDTTQAPAHLAAVDGRATLEREGEIQDAVGGEPFVSGDRLRTEAGRAEIMFPDGSSLAVDEFSDIELLSPTLMRMTTGRVLLRVAGAANPATAIRYQIDSPVGSATTDGPGEFRMALFSSPSGVEAELAVLRGWASLTTERGTTAVRAGERSLARDNLAPAAPQIFNSARFDAFDRWAEARRAERAGTAASSRYLPTDLRVYGGTFDRYGSWQHEPNYGYVWYPEVAVDWRPYYNGYWSPIRPYGWTWVGLDLWSWPTHHYGRWGYRSTRWFWIPERNWAPAWVSWGAAPGYVSWCPLGFDNRPVFGLSVNIGNPWSGWTVIPRGHFGREHVGRWAVDGRRFGGRTPLMTSVNAPVAPPAPRAVPRITTGAASPAAGTAGPRAVGSERSPFTVRESVTGSQQSPAAVQRSPVASQPAGVGGRVATDGSPARNSRAAAGTPRWPVDSRGATSESSRIGGRATPRDPSAVPNVPPTRDVPTVDRMAPNAERRQPGDVWFRQPLPEAAPRVYQRAPSYETLPRGGGGDAPQYRQGSPQWTLPGGAVRSEPQSDSGGGAMPPSAVPRWYGYGGAGGAGPSRGYEAQPEAGSAPAPRSGPVDRGPSMAAPRYESSGRSSGSDGSNAAPSSSGGAGSDGGSRSGGDSRGGSSGGGGGGARQRHP